MTSEFHVPSPLVPVRESYFARYCKQLGPGTWGVVDVSLENMFKYPSICFRRRPSGCLIQAMPNGYSKVRDNLCNLAWFRNNVQFIAEIFICNY